MTKPAQQIIVKKVKKAAHAHHGGAWKIAYADFVTAMMAFFLLMWLISMTTQEQKEGLAEYFAPGAVSPSTSGAGGMLWGSALDKSGSKPLTPREVAMGTTKQEDKARQTKSGAADREIDRTAAAQQASHSAIASLRQALQSMPEIADLSRNIVIEPTKEGLDVALMDENGIDVQVLSYGNNSRAPAACWRRSRPLCAACPTAWRSPATRPLRARAR